MTPLSPAPDVVAPRKRLRRTALRLLGALALLLVVLLAASCVLVTQPVRPAARTGPVVEADAARLEASVRQLATPRDWSDVAALDAVAASLGEQLRALGYEVTTQPFVVKGNTYLNVRTVLGDEAAPRVVVGAHYDSCEPLPGADDNASGVAVVLELARLFKAYPPRGTVELAFWSLEEPPFFRTDAMGSRVHAKSLSEAGVRVTAALSVETVGYYDDTPGSQHFPAPLIGQLYPDRGDFLALVSNFDNTRLVRTVKAAMLGTGRIPVYSLNAPALIPGIDWSDHASFWRVGYPALMVTDTAPNRNPNYHEATDRPETLSYPRLARVTEALFEAVWVLAAQE